MFFLALSCVYGDCRHTVDGLVAGSSLVGLSERPISIKERRSIDMNGDKTNELSDKMIGGFCLLEGVLRDDRC